MDPVNPATPPPDCNLQPGVPTREEAKPSRSPAEVLLNTQELAPKTLPSMIPATDPRKQRSFKKSVGTAFQKILAIYHKSVAYLDSKTKNAGDWLQQSSPVQWVARHHVHWFQTSQNVHSSQTQSIIADRQEEPATRPTESDDDITEKKIIGKGNFGIVYRAKWGNQEVAIKELKKSPSEKERRDFGRERTLAEKIDPHPNIVKCLGEVPPRKNEGKSAIAYEFCEGGPLADYDHARLEPRFKLKFARDIASGMEHLVKNKIVHRDLALRNILVSQPDSNTFVAKVSDFGMSLKIDDNKSEVTNRDPTGPAKWMAPESIRFGQYSEKSDVWSFGVTIWELWTGEEPYADLSPYDVAVAVVDKSTLADQLPDDMPEQLKTLLRSCWEYEPKDRPTFQQIIGELTQIR